MRPAGRRSVRAVDLARRGRLWAALGMSLVACLVSPADGAGAGSPYIPASLYPSGARIVFDAGYSDSHMDAAWNLDAAGEPLMHTLRQRDFLRQSGWMEQGFVNRRGEVAWFIVFDSAYGRFANGQQGNLTAFDDLRLMLSKWWRARLSTHQPSAVFPPEIDGATEMRTITAQSGGPFLVLSAWWGPSREIEAIAFTAPRLLHRTELRRMLVAQVRCAIQHDLAQTSNSTAAGCVA